MDPTVYTFGDPELVVEGLRGVAAIFGSSEWGDDGNAFGLGGNLLSAALIGLLGILLAGISKQEMRVEMLFIAFLMFAILFGGDTDVNVENWFTGEATVVGDVPLGVAWTAALASGAAVNIASNAEAGLSKTGRNTRSISEGGFLDPLKVLMAVRNYNLQELSQYTHRSLMSFYRYCIGRTEESDPAIWDTYTYLNTPDPMTYLTDDANVQNWTTIWYDHNTPEGVAMPCHVINGFFGGTTFLMMLQWSGLWEEFAGVYDRQLGFDKGMNINEEGYRAHQINEAVTTLYDGTYSGHRYMANMMLANAHNDGEAWRIAEYGDSKAQYVATLTAEFEQKAIVAAAEGSIFLQYMFPLMTFFQFIFFILPPFVAFLAIAAPMQSMRMVGYYLLFGVWAYSWFPAAEIINHYIQLTVQDVLLNSGLEDKETGFLSIEGFDDQYNHILTQLTVGSNLLAAVPIAMAALLGGALAGGQKVLGKLGAGTGGKNKSLATPALAEVGPVFKRQPMAVASAGTSVAHGGVFAPPSKPQAMSYGSIQLGQTMKKGVTAAASMARSARQSASGAAQQVASTMRRVSSGSGVQGSQRSQVRTAQQQAVQQSMQDYFKSGSREALTGAERKQVMTTAYAHLFGSGTGSKVADSTGFNKAQDAALEYMQSNSATTAMRAAEQLLEEGEITSEAKQDLQRSAEKIQSSLESADIAESIGEELKATQSAATQMGVSFGGLTTDIVEQMYSQNADALQSVMAKAQNSGIADEVRGAARELWDGSRPIGLDGRRDSRQDAVDQLATTLMALDQMAASNPAAAQVLMESLKQDAKFNIPSGTVSSIVSASEGTSETAQAIEAGGSGLKEKVETARSQQGGQIAASRKRVDQHAKDVSAAAANQADQAAVYEQWRSEAGMQASTYRAQAQASQRRMKRGMGEGREHITGGVAGEAHAWMQGDAGYTGEAFNKLTQLEGGFSPKATTNAMELVRGLETSLRAQQDFETDPMATFQDMMESGFEPRVAAAGAFGSAGYKMPDKHDIVAMGAVGATSSYGYMTHKARGMDKVAGTVAGQLGDEAAEKAGQNVAKKTVARQLVGVARVGGPALAAGMAGYGIYMANEEAREIGEEAQAQINATLLNAVYEMKGEKSFNSFRAWQESDAEMPENPNQLVNQIYNYYGEGGKGNAFDFGIQNNIMEVLEEEYGNTRYEQFRGYLREQPLPQTSTELINHASMYFEGRPYDDGTELGSGAAPILPDWKGDMEVIREEIER